MSRPKKQILCAFLACFCFLANGFVPGFQHSSSLYNQQLSRPTVLLFNAEGSKGREDAVSDTSKPSNSKTKDIAVRLDEALQSFNSSSAQEILSEIEQMRDQDPTLVSKFLENLLANGPDSNLPLWARIRKLPLARFSKRARFGSLRRLLDISSPTVEDSNEEAIQQRRRRTLFSVLRELATSGVATARSSSNTPAVVVLEQKARRELEFSSPTENLRDRLPPGLETPEYSVIMDAGKYEIRDYLPYSVCAVSKSNPRPVDSSKTDAKVSMPEMKGASAFGALAGYLFGKNQANTAMKMTTQVISLVKAKKWPL